MAFVPSCDKCGLIYEKGFTGKFQKEVDFGKHTMQVSIEIRPPHLCKKCLFLALPRIVAEMKKIYNN